MTEIPRVIRMQSYMHLSGHLPLVIRDMHCKLQRSTQCQLNCMVPSAADNVPTCKRED